MGTVIATQIVKEEGLSRDGNTNAGESGQGGFGAGESGRDEDRAGDVLSTESDASCSVAGHDARIAE